MTALPRSPHARPAWRWLAGGLGIAMSLIMLLAGCGGSTSTSTTTGSQNCPIVTSGTPVLVIGTPVTINGASSLHLVAAGQLTVAVDTTYRPAEFIDTQTGQPAGYDIELIQEVGKRLCLQAKIITADFGTIIDSISAPPLGQQRYDLSISSFTIKASRLEKVNMIPYFQAGESILVPKGNPKNISSISDMCGKIVAVQDSTVEADELTDANGGNQGSGQDPVCKNNKIRIQTNSDQDVVVKLLLNGQADASYQDEPVSNYYAAQNPSKLEVGGRTVAPDPQGIVVRKDNPTLEAAIREALREMDKDGTYDKILTKWGVLSGKYTQGQ